MNILIYYPSNNRSNFLETLAISFQENNHKVFFLTHSTEGDLSEYLKKRGGATKCYNVKKSNFLVFYIKHLLFLVSFCRENNISAIQSHLQQSNIIAVFAQYFIKIKLVTYRHHLIEPNKISKYFDKIINKLSNTIVVPSIIIRDKMLNEEYVQESKIKLIPYIYDFTKFETPSDATVADIKKENPCNLLLLLCGRFVPLKRNIIALYALKKLVELKYDVKLLVLDEGPELEQSKKFVVENGLENYVNFLGYRTNVVDYIAACDVLVHPSYTEASNNIVKEAGINSKCVIVCENVGDFSDYIIHEKNGFLANKENPTDDIIKYIKIIYQNKNTIFVGDELKKTILERFQKSDKSVNSHLELLIN